MPKRSRLKVLCGRTTVKGTTCTKEAKDSLGCFFHSENYAQARAENARKGGKLGGRGRASFSKEMRDVRELVGVIIELLAYDKLSLNLQIKMKDLQNLLKAYLQLASYELHAVKAEELEARHANTARELIDTDDIRAHLEDLVRDDERGTYEHLDHPDDAA